MAFLLPLLSAAPALFRAGQSIYRAVVGDDAAPVTTPEDLDAAVAALPDDKRAAFIGRLFEHRERMADLDTRRFELLTGGSAEKVRATARPEIARQAMGVVVLFSQGVRVLFLATVAEWLARLACAFGGWDFPAVSLWGLIAEAAPVAEMIWAPLLGSFWASVEIIKKYMGARERDKAMAAEVLAGRPLDATAATVEAAGGAVSSLIRAWRGGRA